LLIGVVALVLFPDFQSSDHPKDGERLSAPVSVAPISADEAKPQSVVGAAVAPAAPSPAQPASASMEAPAAFNPSVPAPEALKAPVVVPSVVKNDTPTAVLNTAPSQGLVLFKAKGPAWVEVVDAKGVVQLRKTLSAGEAVGASGVLPLSVVVGRVDALDVEVRGKAFSMASVVKDNVARFEVK
jgi:cytoskeleton protein RodZ